MAFFEQELSEGQARSLHAIGDAGLTIGRNAECDIVFASTYVSGRHARISRRDDSYVIEDLQSHNGTFVNGMRVREAVLTDGDRVEIADRCLDFVDRPATRVVLQDDSDTESAEHLIQVRPGDTSIVRSLDLDWTGDADANPTLSVDPQMLLFFRAGERIHAATSAAEMLQSLLELLIELVPCERACILLRKGEGWIPMAVAEDGVLLQDGRISISRSITKRAVDSGTGVMVADAQADRRFDPSRSIVSLGIRSAMAAPLWTGNHAIGLIYMDDRVKANRFSRDHLDLVTAVAYQTALGLERLQLQQQVRHQERAREELQRYHSPDVVEWILGDEQSRTRLAATETVATVLFVDIVGFSRLAEALQPAPLAAFLNEVLSLLTEVVFEFQGTLDKYLGDGLMAIFGAPVSRRDDPQRAVEAGLRMIQDLDQRLSHTHRGYSPKIRVGINTGKVVAGNLGSFRRVDYTVIGDAVNVASRLEQEAGPGQVLVGEETYAQVCHSFRFKEVGERNVKNRTKPVRCYQVVGPRPRA